MTVLAVTGVGLLSGRGRDPAGLSAALTSPASAGGAGGVTDRTVADFDVRRELGRKGTSTFDRRTALSVVSCRDALRDAGLAVDGLDSDRTGVVLGTTAGSVRSAVDFAAETFTQDPPHLVNPALFPNTVLNCAAGQTAIWFGLRGVNATLAGGPVAFLAALRYSQNVFRGRRADVLLTGAVEELTPHSAWMTRASGATDAEPGEGGAVFVLAPAEGGAAGEGAGGRPDAEVLGVALGFAPPARLPAALARCVDRALVSAGVRPGEARAVYLAPDADELRDRTLWRAVSASVAGDATRPGPQRLSMHDTVGDCGSGTGALELAAVVGRHRGRPEHDGEVTVLVAHSVEGALGAAVVRGWSRGVDPR